MRLMPLFASVLYAAILMFGSAGTAHAQSWKKICVNGSATGGANNGTWQKVNTTGTGGGTWKKAGGCVVSPPPPPPTPTPSGPPSNVFIDQTMARNYMGYQRDWQTGQAWVQLTVAADGTWTGQGGGNFQTERKYTSPDSGRWRIAGYSGDQFEVKWVITNTQGIDGTPRYADVISRTTATSAEGVWTSLGSDWSIRMAAKDGWCWWASPDWVVYFDLSIRSKQDPSIIRTESMYMGVHGYAGQHCDN